MIWISLKCLISILSHRFQMLEETKGEGEGHHTYLTTVSSQICPIQHLHKYPILRPNANGILFKKQKLYLTNLFECWAWTSKSITHSSALEQFLLHALGEWVERIIRATDVGNHAVRIVTLEVMPIASINVVLNFKVAYNLTGYCLLYYQSSYGYSFSFMLSHIVPFISGIKGYSKLCYMSYVNIQLYYIVNVIVVCMYIFLLNKCRCWNIWIVDSLVKWAFARQGRHFYFFKLTLGKAWVRLLWNGDVSHINSLLILLWSSGVDQEAMDMAKNNCN